MDHIRILKNHRNKCMNTGQKKDSKPGVEIINEYM
jgi:hypothetical protein